MFINALKMAKTSGKVIIRSKGFIVFGLLLPLFATFLINVWYRYPYRDTVEEMCDLKNVDQQIAYDVDFHRFPVKIYDTLMNDESTAICRSLDSAGMFQIFRADATELSDSEIDSSISRSTANDRISAIVVLREDVSATELYSLGEDPRFELFKTALESELAAPGEALAAPSILLVSGDGEEVDYKRTNNFAYSLAFGCLAFVFGGILILSTVLNEKSDKVYSRILLTSADKRSYFLSKALLSLALTLEQVTVMTVTFALFVHKDIGVTTFQYFFIMLTVGIVFDLISLVGGLFFHSIAAGAIFSFSIFAFSNLISGTYFDIADASEVFKKTALLMPQRWAMFSVTRFLNGDSSGYPLMLCVTAAYLVIIFVVGTIGLRLREED